MHDHSQQMHMYYSKSYIIKIHSKVEDFFQAQKKGRIMTV